MFNLKDLLQNIFSFARRICILGGVLLLTTLTSCKRDAASEEAKAALKNQEKILNVYNWMSYMDPDLLKQFEEETGIHVNYDVFEGDEVLEAKLLSGSSKYDIVVPSMAPYYVRHLDLGFYRELDKSQLPNWKHLDAGILKGMERVDPGNKYGAPYMWGTSGFGYNKQKIKELFPEGIELDSLRVIFDPKIISKLKPHGVILMDYGQDLFDAALYYLGLNNCYADDCLKKAADVIRAIRPHVSAFSNSYNRVVTDLVEGNLILAYGWSGEMASAIQEAKDLGKDAELGYVIPKEWPGVWIDVMAIPNSAPHPDNAHKFINFLLRPEIAAQLSKHLMQATPNKSAIALLPKEMQENPMLFPKGDILKSWNPPKTLSLHSERIRSRLWTRIKVNR